MELSDLKYYERQNIRRRFNCDPLAYVQAYEHQQGLCELCQTRSHRALKPDKFKRTKRLILLCDHCLHWSHIRSTNPQLITDRMMQYFELGDNYSI
jgi:hypothetical protein